MINIKDYIGKLFVGKKLRLKCDCLIVVDITGYCVLYKIHDNEIILYIEYNNKQIPIGLNTPNLQIEVL